MKKLLLLAIVVLGISAVSFGQDITPVNASAAAKTSATIITPISITHAVGDDLLFGKIMVDEDGGTVVIDPTAGTTSYTGLRNQEGMAGVTQPATFTVHGEPNATFSIVKPTNPIVLTKEGSSDDMTVSAVVVDAGDASTLSGLGVKVIKVGATLTVEGGQAAGLYENEGGLEITVAYN